MSLSGSEILRCIETGKNDQALEYLYNRVFPKVRAYIMSNSGSEDDALDMFQDAIVALCSIVKQKKYDSTQDPDAFLFTVSRNLWINKAKRDRRQINMPANFDIHESYDFSDHIVTEENNKILQEIIIELGEKCFQLLQYAIYQRLSGEEICSVMGFSTVNAVKTQKYKCKQKLMDMLDSNPSYREILD